MALWDKISSRGNVEDRRGMAPVAIGGGLSVTAVVVLLLFNLITGGNPTDVLQQLENIPIETQQGIDKTQFAGDDTYEVFASKVLGSNNDMWAKVFTEREESYSPPKLVLFRTATNSSCGTATSAVGPHYCPVDETIYLDETFFDELKNRFGAKGGDVAEAYVIAHEVGHHVQKKLGIMDQVRKAQGDNLREENELSIKLELQADCFAGLWAHSVQDAQILLPGEIDEAIDAAASVGDDRIQKKVSGSIHPETWTHGSSEARVASFNDGFEKGTLSACNTFQ